MPETSVISVGRHRLWVELPDVFAMHWHGTVEASDMHAMYDAVARFSTSCPHIYVLNMVQDTTTLTRAARQVAASDPRSKLLRAMAIVGASFHIRVMSTMLIKAIHLVGKSGQMPSLFFDSADEAHQWFAQLRRERAL